VRGSIIRAAADGGNLLANSSDFAANQQSPGLERNAAMIGLDSDYF
jgi:hypothetical protein